MRQAEEAPLVSVIVPIYNAESYLARCLDSVVGQTYRNLEILLINDGSTDRSMEICRSYGERDSRIRILELDHSGAAAARNVGLDHMCGEYVAFIDADDYMSEQLIQILLHQLLEHHVPIAICNYRFVGESNDDAELDAAAGGGAGLSRRMTRDQVFEALLILNRSGFSTQWGKLFARDIFNRLRYLPGTIQEDEQIFCGIYAQVEEVCYVDLKLYAYRQTLNSVTRKDGIPDASPDVIEIRRKRLAFFREYGVDAYTVAAGKALLRDFAAFSDISDRREARRRMAEMEQEVRSAAGKRCYTSKYILFKLSPRLHRLLRAGFKKARYLLARRRW